MRLNLTPARQLLAALSLLAGLGLSGCTEKEAVEPEPEGCDTVAIVRLCPGKTAVCLTEHTTLELPNGTRLRPTGPLWDAYRPQQFDGQNLRIGYALTSTGSTTAAATVADSDPTVSALAASIICLTTAAPSPTVCLF